MATLPQVPGDPAIPALLGELTALIAEENRKNGGSYSFAYYRGKWIELKYWNGQTQEVILPKDTRITKEAIRKAVRAIDERAGR